MAVASFSPALLLRSCFKGWHQWSPLCPGERSGFGLFEMPHGMGHGRMQHGEDRAQAGYQGGTCCLQQMSAKDGPGLTPGGPIVLLQPWRKAELWPQASQVLGVVGA